MDFISFETPGKQNTAMAVTNAKKNAIELGIKDIVVASTKGDTMVEVLKQFDPKQFHLICVTHNYSFKEETPQEFPDHFRTELMEKGVIFVTGTLAFSGVGSAIMRKYQYFDAVTLFARLVRGVIGDGVKVAMELAMMAVDAGNIKQGQDILTLSGSGTGADTCCWIKAASSRYFDQLRIQAILAKPR